MFDLHNFQLSEMTQCGTALRESCKEAKSIEDAANNIVTYLYDNFVDLSNKEKICALVRFYKTHPYNKLGGGRQDFVKRVLNRPVKTETMRCLTLLSTIGEKSEWNSPVQSKGHKAIPLESEEMIYKFPMISQLINQFEIEVKHVVNPTQNIMLDLAAKTYNIFFVQDAKGSPYVPAQEEFVIPYNIHSVLGFGGMLPTGNLFAVIMFLKDIIDKETADMFRTLSLNVKFAILPFENENLIIK